MTDASPQKPLKRYPIFTLILSVCCALLFMQRHAGFMLYLLAIFWLPWAIFTLVRAIRNPARRKFYLTQIGIWVLALTAAMLVHALYFYRARHHADEIVMKVKDWRRIHGDYPRSFEEIGMDEKATRRQIGNPTYRYREEQAFPDLHYLDTFMGRLFWRYDFEQEAWDSEQLD